MSHADLAPLKAAFHPMVSWSVAGFPSFVWLPCVLAEQLADAAAAA